MLDDFEWDIDCDLATINRYNIWYKENVDPNHDPEYARKQRAKFGKYQRAESNHNESK